MFENHKTNIGFVHYIPLPYEFEKLCELLELSEDDMTFVYVKDSNTLQIQLHTQLYY